MTPRGELHLCLHGLTPGVERGAPYTLDGVEVRPLRLPPGAVAAPLPTTFDQALQELESLDRLFGEPDGSFVWTSMSRDAAPFRFDGQLYDLGPALGYVELKGFGPLEPFDALLTAFGWPEAPLMFQLVRHGVYLDEGEFRRWARLRASVHPALE